MIARSSPRRISLEVDPGLSSAKPGHDEPRSFHDRRAFDQPGRQENIGLRRWWRSGPLAPSGDPVDDVADALERSMSLGIDDRPVVRSFVDQAVVPARAPADALPHTVKASAHQRSLLLGEEAHLRPAGSPKEVDQITRGPASLAGPPSPCPTSDDPVGAETAMELIHAQRVRCSRARSRRRSDRRQRPRPLRVDRRRTLTRAAAAVANVICS